VSISSRIRRSAGLCAIASALLVPAANADPRAQERYYMSFPAHAPVAQEEYYASYGEPSPAPPNASSNETPWLPIAAALAVVAASATQLRRVRVRRRRAVQTPA
jgi:hypothetical protein